MLTLTTIRNKRQRPVAWVLESQKTMLACVHDKVNKARIEAAVMTMPFNPHWFKATQIKRCREHLRGFGVELSRYSDGEQS